MKILLIPLLLSTGAVAQEVQNKDLSALFGAAHFGSHPIAGAAATVDSYTAFCNSFRYGYQVARFSAGSLWVEAAIGTFVLGSSAKGSVPGSALNNIQAYTGSARWMFPVHSRVSLYGAVGAGGGQFDYPVVSGATPHLSSNQTWHGVLELGAGVDFRLMERISIRTEVRDLVSGQGLSGSSGRHHVLPFLGVSFHF